MRAAIGFSVHTGWAAAVVVAERPLAIVERARIELAPDDDARFCYHAAAGIPVFGAGTRVVRSVPLDEAKAIVTSSSSLAKKNASMHVRALLDSIDVDVVIAALPPAKALPALADIVASHARVHAAEGALYVEAIASACVALKLDVVRVARAPALDVRAPGPPWGRDQKLAAALAAAALSGSASKRARA